MPMPRSSSALRLAALACAVASPVVHASTSTRVTVSDAAELEAAFAALPSLTPPVTIEMSAGQYELSEALRGNTSKVILEGVGAVVIKPASGNRALVLDGVDDWLIKGITFTGASVSSADLGGDRPAGAAVLLQNSAATFERVELIGTADVSASGERVSGAIALLGPSMAWFSQSKFTGNSLLGDGGVFRAQDSAMLSLDTCEFTGNVARRAGGAVYARDNANVVVKSCAFTGNTADSGGALWAGYDSQLSAEGSAFTGNRATTSSGGAVRAYNDAKVTIRRSSFSGNVAGNDGGAIFVWNKCELTVEGCTFRGNKAYDEGGALGAWNRAKVSVESSEFEGNSCTYDSGMCGGAVVFWNDVVATFTGVSFGNNTAPGKGGAIANRNDVVLSLDDCQFERNTAGTVGGAVSTEDEVKLDVVSCEFNENVAAETGGAIALSEESEASLRKAKFTSNRAGVGGGAVATSDTVKLAFSRCSFKKNEVLEDPWAEGGRRRRLGAEADGATRLAAAADEHAAGVEGGGDGSRRRLQSTEGGGAMLLGSTETWEKDTSAFSANYAYNGCDAIETQTDGLDPTSNKTILAADVCTNAGADGGGGASWHWPCGMCMRHRCSLWGANKCASRWGFNDPQGVDSDLCACACCRQACARPRGCSVSHLELDEPAARASSARDALVVGPATRESEPPIAAEARATWAPAPPPMVAAVALAVAAFALSAWRQRSRPAETALV